MPLPRPKPGSAETEQAKSKADRQGEAEGDESNEARRQRRRQDSPKPRASPKLKTNAMSLDSACHGDDRSAMRNRRCGAASPARCRRSKRGRGRHAEAAADQAATAAEAGQNGRRRRRIRSPLPRSPRPSQRQRAGAGAARSPLEAEAGARHAGDRRAARPARPHPERGACRAVAVPAPGAGARREDRAGDHRQGRQRGDGERGVLKRQVPMWLALPEFRAWWSASSDAAIGHGGEGALYVRVRRK